MSSYRLDRVGVIRLSDGARITRDMVEWADYQSWLKAGGEPEPILLPPVDMVAARAKTWAACRQRRDTLEASGFPYLGHLLDSDPRAVQRINTAVQAAQAAVGAGQPFQIGWTCMDGQVLPLDAAGMMGMPVALAMHANGLHQVARSFKVRIGAASTVEELMTIDAEIKAW